MIFDQEDQPGILTLEDAKQSPDSNSKCTRFKCSKNPKTWVEFIYTNHGGQIKFTRYRYGPETPMPDGLIEGINNIIITKFSDSINSKNFLLRSVFPLNETNADLIAWLNHGEKQKSKTVLLASLSEYKKASKAFARSLSAAQKSIKRIIKVEQMKDLYTSSFSDSGTLSCHENYKTNAFPDLSLQNLLGLKQYSRGYIHLNQQGKLVECWTTLNGNSPQLVGLSASCANNRWSNRLLWKTISFALEDHWQNFPSAKVALLAESENVNLTSLLVKKFSSCRLYTERIDHFNAEQLCN